MRYDLNSLEAQLEEILGASLHPERAHASVDPEGNVIACFRANLDGKAHRLAVEAADGPVENISAIRQRAEEVGASSPGYIYLLAAPYLADEDRSRLEASNVNYVDFSGHAFIRSPGIVVRIDTPADPPSVKARASKGPNPFAKKASFVLRLLLDSPERAWGVREIKRELPLSVGHVSNVLHEAERRGYVEKDEGGVVLANPERILAHWSAEYSWDDNEIYSLQVPYEQDEIEVALKPPLEQNRVRSVLTLLAASDRLARSVIHDQMHLYVEESGVDFVLELLRSQLHAEAVSHGGNVHILRPYYREATFFGAQYVDDVPVVSDIQLFLDLARYPLRGQEAVQKLLRSRIGPKLDLSDKARQWLAGFIGEL